MKNIIKNLAVSFSFIIIIFGFMLANILMPDKEFSYSERRKLVSMPDFSADKLFKGNLADEYEKYILDHFAFRDNFRGFKAFGKYYIFNQKDNNNIYIIDGIIEKMDYKLNEKSALNAARKFNEIYEKFLKGKNVSYSIIPDKGYFIGPQNGYLTIDYDRLEEIMLENTKNMKYIDLFEALTIEDYYKTDIHWRQEKIVKIAGLLLNESGNDKKPTDTAYMVNNLYPFYGSYYGQAALKLQPDTMVYLSNKIIDNALVYDPVSDTYSSVYMADLFNGMDSYDVFLSGAKPLISIYNEECGNNKELLLFRDSFGSSIAPLMVESYSKITLIDLRYISTDLLADYIDFSQDQDALFLYNTQILNKSSMLK